MKLPLLSGHFGSAHSVSTQYDLFLCLSPNDASFLDAVEDAPDVKTAPFLLASMIAMRLEQIPELELGTAAGEK